MGRKVWLISDTHFGHSNIIKYCDRPFETSTKMDIVIRNNWNKTVSNDDIVYHLGDVYFGKEKCLGGGESFYDFLSSLNGHKRLILGNHDNGKNQVLLKVFEKVLMWRMFPEFKAVLTHVPLHPSSIREEFVNYHGHIHNQKSPPGLYKNVSVEAIDYTPILLGETKSAQES